MRHSKPAGGNNVPGASKGGVVPAADAAAHEAVVRSNDDVQSINRNIELTVDEGANGVVVRICNLETREVIREIQADEALDFSREIVVRNGRSHGPVND